MTRTPRPPRLALLLVTVWFGADAREVVRGDLDEWFADDLEAGLTPAAARRRYWRSTLASLLDAAPGEGRSAPTGPIAGTRPMAFPRAALHGLGTDLRFTLRGLRKSPGFAGVAILSLAIGIGANTSIFTVIRSVLLTELPVDRPDELRLIYWSPPPEYRMGWYSVTGIRDPDSGVLVSSNYTYPQYEAMRAAAPDAPLFGFQVVQLVSVAVGDRQAVVGGGLLVSGDFFDRMRLPMAVGRPLNPSDDRPDAPLVAVISHAFWQRAFGGSPAALGMPVRINGHVASVVGITPAGYRGLSPGGVFPPMDITTTLATAPVMVPSWVPPEGSLFGAVDRAWMRMGARIPANTPEAPLADALTSVLRRSAAEHSPEAAAGVDHVTARLLPGARGLDSNLRIRTQQPLAILAVIAGIVLLIACANLASLLLARGAFRQEEFEVRRALGASRVRLVRQLLLESVVLAAAGGLAGLGLAYWSGRAITAAITAGLGPVAVSFTLDRQMLLGALALSALAALLCGLLPAFRLSRMPSGGVVRAFGATASASRQRLGRALIAVQIAASVPLLVGAGLLLRTAGNLNAVELGYDPAGLVFFRLNPSLADGPRLPPGVVEEIVDRIQRLPGVDGASVIGNVLLSGRGSDAIRTVNGESRRVAMNAAGAGLFATLGVPMRSGRDFGPEDRADAPAVVVVNESAEREWFGGAAVGQRIDDFGADGAEIVGVTEDMRFTHLEHDFVPTIYYPAAQRRPRELHIVFRTAAPPASLEPQVREAVASVDRLLPVTNYASQSDVLALTFSRERTVTTLLAVFGAFALFLACLGLHGLTNFAVARRTKEIGIRLALGARRDQIVWLMLRQVIVLAGIGLAIGVPVALRASTVVESMLFGLEPGDAATVGAAALVMLVVAVTAGWLPARRAARLDAMRTLKES